MKDDPRLFTPLYMKVQDAVLKGQQMILDRGPGGHPYAPSYLVQPAVEAILAEVQQETAALEMSVRFLRAHVKRDAGSSKAERYCYTLALALLRAPGEHEGTLDALLGDACEQFDVKEQPLLDRARAVVNAMEEEED